MNQILVLTFTFSKQQNIFELDQYKVETFKKLQIIFIGRADLSKKEKLLFFC